MHEQDNIYSYTELDYNISYLQSYIKGVDNYESRKKINDDEKEKFNKFDENPHFSKYLHFRGLICRVIDFSLSISLIQTPNLNQE